MKASRDIIVSTGTPRRNREQLIKHLAIKYNKYFLNRYGDFDERLASHLVSEGTSEEDGSKEPIYISPYCARTERAEGSQKCSLLEGKIEEFFYKGGTRSLLLLGQSGVGKSYSTLRFCREKLKKMEGNLAKEKSLSKQEKLPLPLYIYLPEYTNQLKNGGLLERVLQNRGISDEGERSIIMEEPLLLILDGFDEIPIDNNFNFYGVQGWDASRDIRILVTSRPEALLEKPLTNWFGVRGSYERYHLQPFTKEQVGEYFEECFKGDAKKYLQDLQKISSLEALVVTPFLLKITAQILPNITSSMLEGSVGKFHFTQSKLFDYFLNGVPNSEEPGQREGGWFWKQIIRDSEQGRLPNSNISAERYIKYMNVYAENLATYLLDSETKQLRQEPLANIDTLNSVLINPTHVPSLLRKHRLADFWENDKANEVFFYVRSGCLLRICGSYVDEDGEFDGNFEFLHKSIAEYLVAQKLKKELLFNQNNFENWLTTEDENESGEKQKRGLNRVLLTKEPEIIARLAEMANESDKRIDFNDWKPKQAAHGELLSLKQLLFNILMASKGNPDLGIAAANAITILNAAKEFFRWWKLQDVCIQEADLSGAICDGADFSRASLTGVNFHRASLREVNLQAAIMSEVQFGECPVLVRFKDCNVVVYSSDGRYLAVADNQKKVYLYDMNLRQLKCELGEHEKGDKYRVSSVAFSPDSKQVVTGDDKGTVRIWDIESNSQPLLYKVQLHTGKVLSIVFSSDGKYIGTGGGNEAARLWYRETKTSKLLYYYLYLHTGKVLSVVFSLDSKQLVAGDDNGMLRTWYWNTSENNNKNERGSNLLYGAQGHTAKILRVIFSPDGKRVIMHSDKKSWLQDTAKTSKWYMLKDRSSSTSGNYAFSPDGKQVVGSSSSDVCLWDAETDEREPRKLPGHGGEVWDVAFSPDGSQVLTACCDGIARLWNAKTGNLIYDLRGHTHRVRRVVFSPDGEHVVTESKDMSVRLWDIKANVMQHASRRHVTAVLKVAFSPDDKQVVTVGSWYGGTAYLWDVKTGYASHQLHKHDDKHDDDGVLSIAFSPSGAQVVTGRWSGAVQLWSVETGKLLRELSESTNGSKNLVKSVAFSPDGKQVVAITMFENSEIARLWDIEKEEPPVLLRHGNGVTSVAFGQKNEDEWRLVTGCDDGTVCLWLNLGVKPLLLNSLKLHEDRVESVTFSHDGRRVAAGSYDGVAYIYDASSAYGLQFKFKLKGHASLILDVLFSPDDTQVLTVAGGSKKDATALLWNAKKGELLHVLREYGNYRVENAVFSPDGKQVLTGCNDGMTRLWDVEKGKRLHVFPGYGGDVSQVAAFSSDGKQVVIGGGDKSVCFWSLLPFRESGEFSGEQRFTKESNITDERWSLQWSSHPSQQLNLYKANIEKVQGISCTNRELMVELGAQEVSDISKKLSQEWVELAEEGDACAQWRKEEYLDAVVRVTDQKSFGFSSDEEEIYFDSEEERQSSIAVTCSDIVDKAHFLYQQGEYPLALAQIKNVLGLLEETQATTSAVVYGAMHSSVIELGLRALWQQQTLNSYTKDIILPVAVLAHYLALRCYQQLPQEEDGMAQSLALVNLEDSIEQFANNAHLLPLLEIAQQSPDDVAALLQGDVPPEQSSDCSEQGEPDEDELFLHAQGQSLIDVLYDNDGDKNDELEVLKQLKGEVLKERIHVLQCSLEEKVSLDSHQTSDELHYPEVSSSFSSSSSSSSSSSGSLSEAGLLTQFSGITQASNEQLDSSTSGESEERVCEP